MTFTIHGNRAPALLACLYDGIQNMEALVDAYSGPSWDYRPKGYGIVANKRLTIYRKLYVDIWKQAKKGAK